MNRAKRRNSRKELQKLYKCIPDCKCKGLCTEACGPVPFSAMERLKVENKAPNGWVDWDHGTYMPRRVPADDLTCPFLKDSKCSIYKDRPLICRIYGSVEDLQCGHGCKPTITKLQENKIRDKYLAIIKGE